MFDMLSQSVIKFDPIFHILWRVNWLWSDLLSEVTMKTCARRGSCPLWIVKPKGGRAWPLLALCSAYWLLHLVPNVTQSWDCCVMQWIVLVCSAYKARGAWGVNEQCSVVSTLWRLWALLCRVTVTFFQKLGSTCQWRPLHISPSLYLNPFSSTSRDNSRFDFKKAGETVF